MATEKKALVGAHQRMTGVILDATLSPLGYTVERVEDLPQMLEKCEKQDYDLYVMDANLGIPGAPTIEPAQQVHQALYARGHERGLETRLHTFSGNEGTVDLAKAQGLNVYLSPLTRELIGEIIEKENKVDEKALLGIHGDPIISRGLARCISRKFQSEPVFEVEQMLNQCRKNKYGLYVMDLNFGKERTLDVTSAQRVYQLLQEQKVIGLEKKFIGISARDDVVELAQKQGIPAVAKTSFVSYFNELFP